MKRSNGQAEALGLADLGQRGRADMQVLGGIQVAAFRDLRRVARETFYATEEGRALGEAHTLEDGDTKAVRARVDEATKLARQDPTFRMKRFLQRYVAEENWRRAIMSVEAKRSNFEAFIEPTITDGEETKESGSLELDPNLAKPRFFDGIEFHLQPGGWEGYDLYGPVLSYAIYPHVFARGGFAAVPATAGARDYRPRVIRTLPKTAYRRIFEVGCGSGTTLRWLRQSFPEAELTGCDLSEVQLKSGFELAQSARLAIHFKQRDGRRTNEPADSFDLVVHNALAHEMPPKANIEVFEEMFRILTPGGDFLLVDPPPFRSVDPFQAAILNWETEHREEPFFSAALLSDWNAELGRIGFVSIHAEVFDGGFPWVLVASKPQT